MVPQISSGAIAVPGLLDPESPLCPYECAILSPSRRCSAFFPCYGREAKDLLRCSSGQPIIHTVLDSPAVQRSRSFGCAETVSKHFAVHVASLRMACRGGEMDR